MRARLIGIFLCACAASACAGEALSFRPTTAMTRIGGADGTIPGAAAEFSLEMVRNEREGVQFALTSAGENVEIKSVTVKALSEGAPASALFQVLSVNHTAVPKDAPFAVPARRLGLIPDVLLPLAGRAQGATAIAPKQDAVPLTYYVEFHTTAGTQPKPFDYEITVDSSAGAAVMRIHLTVADATLPVRLPFRTGATWNWSLNAYYGRELTLDEKRAFWNICLDHRLSPCAFFSREPDPAPAELAALKDRGLSMVALLMAPKRVFSEKDKQRYTPLIEKWRAELKTLGLEHDTFVLLADEPGPDKAPIARENGQWLKQQFPELKLWVATRPGSPWDEFVDVFDTVTAHSTEKYAAHSHDEFALRRWLQSRKNPRSEYWWFHSVEPYGAYTNLRLDNLPIEGRVSGWQSALYAVDAYEYFWIADWSQNKDSAAIPWPQRAEQWKTGLSGAGTLLYPDEKMLPMPSLRLVNLRDGIEDWALLEMHNGRGKSMRVDPALLAVTKSLGEYATDPAIVLDSRRKVIEALAAKPK